MLPVARAASPRTIPVFFCVFFAALVFQATGNPFTFSNTNYITINDSPVTTPPGGTKATPYPSSIAVTGLNGLAVTNLTVTLNGFSHDYPSDVSILLVSPLGQMAMLMSIAGGGDSVTNLTITLDDSVPYLLPIDSTLYSATFKPGVGLYPLDFDLALPAPPGNSNAPPDLSVFNGSDPSGVWNLFVVDGSSGDAGYISNGWTMNISVGVPLTVTRSGIKAVLSWPAVTNLTFIPQFTPSITNLTPPVWSNILTTPIEISNRFYVTNSTGGSNRFYRLISQ